MRTAAFLLPLAAAAGAADFDRELSPDRPDTTESPYTVGSGTIQIESSLWSWSRDRANGIETQTWQIAETNVKFGVAPDHDLQLVIRPFVRETERGASVSDAEGFGDIDVRWKWNLWGNAGGSTAAALMPFVSIPSGTSVSTGEWQGGIIFTVATELGGGWGGAFQVELDRVWDDGSSRHEWDFLHSVSVGRDLGENLGFYAEYIGITGAHPYEAYAAGGLTWSLGGNAQLDLGAVAGLNDAAEDLSVFQGVTFRF